ncbi:EpsG family protein [Acinetobacter johnsonii]|uniref:Transmembrane protein EpsG n=1 Tax=Acinetobacter johnsonii TaxID=40214 RepID=A0A1R7QF81_ACIJO|nr:EpsG family protein [Acinetobacter johnsonii]SJX22930.1 Transmembrane protein EpsG [Acinetobacter johnsonii]
MLPYIIILLFVVSVIYFEAEYLGRKAIIFPSIFLIMFSSIRSYSVGTDSISYTEAYRFEYDPYYYGFNSNIEYGYQFFDYFILNFFSDYFWLFLFFSTIVVCLYMITIKRISINYLVSVFVFITFGFYTFFFNGLRQGVAMAICFFGLPYLIEKRIIPYFLVVLTASMFHVSALVMLPVYFLVLTRIKIEYKILACFIVSILASQIVIGYLAQGNIRYEHYTQEAEKAGGYITLLFYSLIGFLIYSSGKKIRLEDVRFDNFQQIFLCGLALVLPISLLGTDPSGPQRILYYFSSIVIFLIPYVLKKFNNVYFNILFFILSIIYFLLITMRFGDLYPYKINSFLEIF